jgi:hypothetical protein
MSAERAVVVPPAAWEGLTAHIDAPSAAWARRVRLRWPLVLSAIVAGAALRPLPRLVDAESMRAAAGADLALPLSYALLSPLCETMDALTLLSVRQHVALLATAALAFVAWRALDGRPRSARRELRLAAGALGAVVAVYGVGIVASRPMAALRLADPELMAVDFHSHTDASWDGRPGFGAEANRAWHRAAGFDVAYVSDHGTLDGVRGAARRPAGGGTVLLPAVESWERREHVIVLGATRARPELTGAEPPGAMGTMHIFTIPGALEGLPALAGGPVPLRAVELADGGPRGIEQGWRERARILRLADSLGLAVVAGSDNHGWGRTAAAWSVLRVPGWRAAPPDSLDGMIQRTLAGEERRAVAVVTRRSPPRPASAGALALTAPAIAWSVLASLTGAERVVWLAWIWGAALLAEARGRRVTTAGGGESPEQPVRSVA